MMRLTSLSQILLSREMGRDRFCQDGKNNYLTWADFLRDVERLQAYVSHTQKSHWAIVNSNTYRFAVSLFAVLAQHKIPVLLPNAQVGTIKKFSDQFDCLIDNDCYKQVMSVENKSVESPQKITALSLLDLNTDKIHLFTSGSTGKPKKCTKYLRQLDAEIHTLEAQWGQQLQNNQIVASVSHYHIYGLLFRMLWPICAGRCFMSQDIKYPEDLVYELTSNKAITFVTSPAFLKRLFLDEKVFENKKATQKISVIFSSGDMLPYQNAQQCRDILHRWPVEVYGSSETGGIGYRQANDQPESLWQCFPGIQINADSENRLIINSPYLESAQPYCTDDLVKCFDKTKFKFLGRKDDVVKIEEKRVSLAEIKQYIFEHVYVEDVEVKNFILHDRHSIVALVVLNVGGKEFIHTAGELELKQQLRQTLMRYLDSIVVPKKIIFIEQLPRDKQGKISEQDIVDILQANFDMTKKVPEVITLAQSGNRVDIELSVSKDILYFCGHFSEYPILPGVTQLHWVIDYAKRYFAIKGQFKRMVNVKFRSLIRPEMSLSLSLNFNANDQKLSFKYASSEQVFSSGTMVFGGTHD